MKRTVVAVGVLVLGAGAVLADQKLAVEQDNLMRTQGKSMYGVLAKMVKGDIPFDQKAVDEAIGVLETNVPKIAATFKENPGEDVVDATYGSSPKIWQNFAGFEAKIPPVKQAIADVKGKVTSLDELKVAFKSINDRCTDCHETFRVKLK